ncbi:unnamed protein product, partial [marine sediment metagenome]
AFADYHTLANSLAKKVVKMLIEEDILELTVIDIKKATASETKIITTT